MIYKVGLLGATGRMGRELVALLEPGFVLGEDRLELSNQEAVKVWIDFSRPEGTLSLLEKIKEPIVIGTTGFNTNQLEKIKNYSEAHPVLLTSNTSPGMNLMMKMLGYSSIAAALGYDVLASEIHHRGKKDSPSGTLKSLLQVLEKQGIKNIQVQSARVGDEKGTHTISFFSDEEELTLTHRVNHRRVFAKGALLAAKFIANQKKPGLYSFQDMEKL
ncbi:MAG: 4-hydroxy-tetrahydrodipicolinate reductase [Pseudomonadota bacterium]